MSEGSNDTAVETIEPLVPPPLTVGGQLRAAREARGMSVAEAAQILKLGQRQLEALESDDWAALPGVTFTRGFIRNYARLLHLDAVPLMERLDRELVINKPDIALKKDLRASMPEPVGAPQKRDYAFVSVGAAALVVALLIYFFMPNDLSRLIAAAQSLLASASRPAAESAQAPAMVAANEPVLPPGASLGQVINPQSAQAAPESASAAQAAAPAATAGNGAAPLLRLAFDKESWVDVRDRNGRVLFQQSGPAGTERDIEGEPPFALTIGYAPGVRVLLRGQPVDLAPHLRGDVARLTVE